MQVHDRHLVLRDEIDVILVHLVFSRLILEKLWRAESLLEAACAAHAMCSSSQICTVISPIQDVIVSRSPLFI